uniref:Uncharacterized protein n=1 Tax=Ciona intestinalis TaxID=7719 RepID=F6UU58_CIOIN
ELIERTRNLVDFCPAIWYSVASEQWAGCAITIIPCASIQPAAGTAIFNSGFVTCESNNNDRNRNKRAESAAST